MKVIVLCGSMKIKDDLIKIGKELEDKGYIVLLPTECLEEKPKSIASRAHFNRIIDTQTDAILVVNNKKEDIANYIGPNTFAEIAFAYHFNKKIFLLNDLYQPYEDELIGWNAICLHQNLDKIK